MSVRVGDDIVAGSSGDVYTKTQVDALIAAAVAQTTEKPGMIKPFAGTTIPTGYLLCDGSAVSRTTYADLFAAIGTTYGSGDGNSTFNLPDFGGNHFSLLMCRDLSYPSWSSWAPNMKYEGALPAITGSFGVRPTLGAWFNIAATTGAFFTSGGGNNGGAPEGLSNERWCNAEFNASRSSSLYWRTDDRVIPSGVIVLAIIKY